MSCARRRGQTRLLPTPGNGQSACVSSAQKAWIAARRTKRTSSNLKLTAAVSHSERTRCPGRYPSTARSLHSRGAHGSRAANDAELDCHVCNHPTSLKRQIGIRFPRSMTATLIPELTLLDSEAGAFAFYTWRNILITCWSKQATGPAVQRLTRLRESMATQHPEGVSAIYLIGDQAGLPTPEARAGVRELMARFSGQRACLAVVVEGEGLRCAPQSLAYACWCPINFKCAYSAASKRSSHGYPTNTKSVREYTWYPASCWVFLEN
jgi:hypothetical protein